MNIFYAVGGKKMKFFKIIFIKISYSPWKLRPNMVNFRQNDQFSQKCSIFTKIAVLINRTPETSESLFRVRCNSRKIRSKFSRFSRVKSFENFENFEKLKNIKPSFGREKFKKSSKSSKFSIKKSLSKKFWKIWKW